MIMMIIIAVIVINTHCPAWYAYAANAVGKDLDIFAVNVYTFIHLKLELFYILLLPWLFQSKILIVYILMFSLLKDRLDLCWWSIYYNY
jgi:hypothetical protein